MPELCNQETSGLSSTLSYSVPRLSSLPSTRCTCAMKAPSSCETVSDQHHPLQHRLCHRWFSALLSAWIEKRWEKSTAPTTSLIKPAGESQLCIDLIIRFTRVLNRSQLPCHDPKPPSSLYSCTAPFPPSNYHNHNYNCWKKHPIKDCDRKW